MKKKDIIFCVRSFRSGAVFSSTWERFGATAAIDCRADRLMFQFRFPMYRYRTFFRQWAGAFAAATCMLAGPAPAADSVTRHGVTWTFSGDAETGVFANGDPWVVGPVTITAISPGMTELDGVTQHGSMLGPEKPGSRQGFDSRIRNNSYLATLNIERNLPVVVEPGNSVLSAVSDPKDRSSSHRCQMHEIAILTVLDEPAPEGSFRPPYVGTDRKVRWNVSQLDREKLRQLPKPANTPDIGTAAGWFERPWIELNTSWTGRYLHPQKNQPDYGREIANQLGTGLLALQLDFTREQKEPLLVRLVQFGIDVYGTAKAGGVWEDLGGHNPGRKMPLLLAGAMLGDEEILAYADAGKHFIFQDDRQHFYVSQSDVDRERYEADGRPREPYTVEMIGMPEWGEQHTRQPKRDGSNWKAPYRWIGSAMAGHVLTARLMGLRDEWNHPATFDYMDRYCAAEIGSPSFSGTNAIEPFVKTMWTEYRDAEPAADEPAKPAKPKAPLGLRVIEG